MLKIKAIANAKLTEYMTDNNINSPLRVALMNGGCAGMTQGLALDEEKENGTSFTEGGLTVLVDKGLLLQCGEIEVDSVENVENPGFAISSKNPIEVGGCSSGSCGSGGCGG